MRVRRGTGLETYPQIGTGRCRRPGRATPVAAIVLAAVLASGPVGAEALRPPADWPLWARLLARELAPLRALAASTDAVWERLPVVRAEARGIIGDGRTDATRAIQAALDSLTEGGTLVLGRGIYVHSRCLVLRHRRTRILGEGARLHASNPADMCVSLEGDETELRGLEFSAITVRRGLRLETARVTVHGRGTRVLDNRIVGATSAGIWIHGARDFAIVGNRVTATLADGIHSSDGASNGYVARNVTDITGDDGISVVSYLSGARSGRILIEDNRVSNVHWARGIALVGAYDVLVRRNAVAGTERAAGIIVTREQSFNTYGVDRVIVADNDVSGVARLPPLAPTETTGQATIDVNAHVTPTPDLQVRQVLISGNALRDGLTDGIRLLGGVCDVTVTGNEIRGMKGRAIAVVEPTCRTTLARCAGNAVESGSPLPSACKRE